MYHSEIFKTSFPLMKYDSLKVQYKAPKAMDFISKTKAPVYFEQTVKSRFSVLGKVFKFVPRVE